MAMIVGGNKHGPVSDPNIVPLIDVLLVLIIIFMVITPQVATGLSALLPQPAPPSKVEPVDPHLIVVQVLEGGKLLINEEQTDWDTLGARLSEVFSQRAQKLAFVKGGEEVPFAQVARAIDIMHAAGIDHVGLITAGTPPAQLPALR